MREPFPIQREAIYDDSHVCLALNLTSSTLARERREGRLRFQRKGNRVFYLGQWLIDWMNLQADAERQEVARAAS